MGFPVRNFSARAQGLIAINVAAVIFGSAALYGKLDISPFWITAMRAGFAAVALLVLGLWKGDAGVPGRGLRGRVVLTGVTLAVHWLSFFASVQMAGVAVATLTFASFPLFTVLIEAWRQRRRPHMAEIGAAGAIILAVGLLVHPQDGHGGFGGAVIGLASAVTYALFWHGSRGLHGAMSPHRISMWQNAAAAIVLMPFLVFVPPGPAHMAEWFWLGLLGVVNTALMLQLYLFALKSVSASVCSGFVALEPVYAILLAAAFFHEPVTGWVMVSAGLIVGASFVLLRGDLETGV